MMNAGLSAVVATLNRRDELKRLFDSFKRNAIEHLEVIVVDQNKEPFLEDLVNEYANSFKIIHVKMNEANQSKARNYGASLATQPFVCFPDDDCWFEENSLSKVLETFSENPETGLLIIHWNQNPVQNVKGGKLIPTDIYSFRSVGYATYVLFFRREVFLKLGGFVEMIGIGKYIGGGEDSEITFRAAKQGVEIFYNEKIHVNHHYISVYTRPLPIIRARQRAMGLLYALYPVTNITVVRGLLSPVVKMFTCGSMKELKKHGNVFTGRIEGFIYGLNNRKKILK